MSKQSEINWQVLFEEQKRSGLTVVAFCKERNINSQTFYTRRYKHKKRGLIGTAEPGDFIVVSQVTADCDNSPTLTVQCGDVSILVPASFDMGQLAVLVKELR